jgi:hypothetical protein
MNPKLAVVLYSLACAFCLAAFAMIPNILKYVFSLGAFFLGLRFFGTYETWGVRLALIGLSIVFFFVFIFIYTIFAAVNGWYLPQMPEARALPNPA